MQMLSALNSSNTSSIISGITSLIDTPNNDQVRSVIESTIPVTDSPQYNTEYLVKTVRSLRKQGMRLPLKYTLLVKNLYGIDKLARDAGLNGLQEALLYT